MTAKTGVYLIKNLRNNKVYVGSGSVCIRTRMRTHKSRLVKGNHPNRHLQSAWAKYGCASFQFLVVELCSPESCLDREQFWIDFYCASDHKFGYNKSPEATSRLGCKCSPESRAKMSAAKKGKKLSPDAIAERTAKIKGMKRSEETKEKMRLSAKRRGISDDLREKMNSTRRSPEGRLRASMAQMGRKASEDARRIMSEAQKRRFQRAEERQKQSIRLKGNSNAKKSHA